MIPVPEVHDVDIAFPARGKDLAPLWEEIPDKHKAPGPRGRKFFEHWFYGFVQWELVGFLPKEGVDPNAAWRALRVVAGTFAISHEHKEAAVSYLIEEWFRDVRWTTTDGEHYPFEDEDFDREWLAAQEKGEDEG